VVPGVVLRWVFVYSGSQLVAEYLVTPAADTSVDVQTADACVAGCYGINAAMAAGGHPENNHRSVGGDKAPVVGRVWVTDPVSGVMVGQLNLHQTTGGVVAGVASGGVTGGVVAGDAYDTGGDTADGSAGGGVCGWSQHQVDAVFYALVADLAGAPQELIDLGDGSVAGWVTQSLYGRRCWRGVDSPLLFIGQYEDQESGWVYNRFRFYDPWSGVYGSQDPLGVVPNPATPQGYVGNPVLWVDPDALKACPNYPELILQMKRTVDEIQLGRLDTAIEGVRKGLNVAGMVDMDGNIYYAMGAMKNLDPADYPGLNILRPELLAPNAVNNYKRVVDHAEQKLLNYAKVNNIDVAAIYTYLDACPANLIEYRAKLVEDGMVHGYKLCDRVMNESGLFGLEDSHLYVTDEMRKILTGDTNLIQKAAKFITRGLR